MDDITEDIGLRNTMGEEGVASTGETREIVLSGEDE